MKKKIKECCGGKTYCDNPDYSWRTNRLKIGRIKFYKDFKNRPRMRILYRIECKKCGHLREQGNCFGWKVIKQLVTGKSTLCF